MAKDSKAQVGIIMGSASDVEIMQAARDILDEFGVISEFRALSAHRTPEEVNRWSSSAEERGLEVIIAGAGMAAHLAGVVAAHTTLPVIGVPIASGALAGFDSLLSTVQMPKGTPVATVAVGRVGAANAALLALRILALKDNGLKDKVVAYKKQLAEKVVEADKLLSK